MFAIVEIGGSQFEIQPNSLIKTQLINGNPGDEVEINKVLLVETDGKTLIGNPYVNATVKASIVSHGKDSKVIVFKKWRRNDNRRLRGHRQGYTLLEIKEINLS
ncbi:MAG: 50S ribosomal protein L21 [Candidatus Kapaibacteriales bacterium]